MTSPNSEPKPEAGEKMLCQEVYASVMGREAYHREPCSYPVTYVAKGPGYTKFICGYHKRAYTNVETLEEWLNKRR